jgi:hypothetical protein
MQEIFVFGSNLAGRHGAGAAKFARENYGAVYGEGIGHHGNSYAIPTKDFVLKTLTLDAIQRHVNDFLEYANNNPSLIFKLTPIGCGLAGYSPKDIAPMFVNAPPNVRLPLEFQQVIGGS